MYNNQIKYIFEPKLAKNTGYYKFFIFFVSLIISYLLVSLPIDGLIDRESYLKYPISSPILLLANYSKGVLTLLTNEPLWLIINSLLSIYLSPENVVRSIIAFSSFVTFFLIFNNTDKKYFILVLMFLFLPMVLKNNLIHLRQGLGITFFLLGWFSSKNTMKYILYICAAFIHSSFYIVLFGILGVHFLLWLKISFGVRAVIYIITGVLFGFFGTLVAQKLGARQGELYNSIATQGSGLGFLYWGGLFIFLLFQGKMFLRTYAIEMFFLALYLSTYFLLPISARLFESTVLIVLLSTLNIRNKYKIVFIIYYCLFFILMWGKKITSEGYGWFVT